MKASRSLEEAGPRVSAPMFTDHRRWHADLSLGSSKREARRDMRPVTRVSVSADENKGT